MIVNRYRITDTETGEINEIPPEVATVLQYPELCAELHKALLETTLHMSALESKKISHATITTKIKVSRVGDDAFSVEAQPASLNLPQDPLKTKTMFLSGGQLVPSNPDQFGLFELYGEDGELKMRSKS